MDGDTWNDYGWAVLIMVDTASDIVVYGASKETWLRGRKRLAETQRNIQEEQLQALTEKWLTTRTVSVCMLCHIRR